MEKIKNIKSTAKEQTIDNLVIEQANNDQAWEKELDINPKSQPTSIRLNTRTIQRAKFFARVHRQRGYQSWLKNIIEERINTEYELYKRLKRQTQNR
jgi:hypothetical protein